MSGRKGKSEADRIALALREVQSSLPENKRCFECDQRGPTYVDMTVGSFVCTKCSGMLRGITPPHRIKSISMSSFTVEEVEFLRGRGNAWCYQVWMGLYDKSKGVGIGHDDEATKELIVQKYEKKRYYVDPGSVRPSVCLSSPVVVEAATTSTSAKATLGSGMIGTTLQLKSRHSNHTSSNSSSYIPKRSGLSLPPSVSGVPPVLPQPSVAKPQTQKAKLSSSTPPVSAVVSTNSSSVNDALSALSILTAPSALVDPFAPTDQEVNPVQIGAQSGGAVGEANFANFESAHFDSKTLKADPLPHPSSVVASDRNNGLMNTGPPPKVTSTSASSGLLDNTSVDQDRYAALKDLDDIFKSSICAGSGGGGDNNNGPVCSGGDRSTGTSIFGASPAASVPVFSGTFSSSVGVMNPMALAAQGSTNTLSSASTIFGSTTNGGGTCTTSSSSNVGWATSWPAMNTMTPASNSMMQSSGKSVGSSINPFAGAANLNQLNTSPWPTTGTSPVQTTAPSWPPMAFCKSTTSSAMGNISSTSATSSGAQQRSAFPLDPFGAAPRGQNFNHQSEPNDLFANAPKPTLGPENKLDTNLNALAADIFGQVAVSSSTSNTGFTSNGSESDAFGLNKKSELIISPSSNGNDIDPWANVTPIYSSPFSNGGSESGFKSNSGGVFTSSMKPSAANPNNPFL